MGIAPIMGRLMADDLDVRLECVDMPWPEHIPALLSGKVDLLPKHVNTPKRALLVEFTNGRFMLYRVTALIQEKRLISDKEDLNQEGKLSQYGMVHQSRTLSKKNFHWLRLRSLNSLG